MIYNLIRNDIHYQLDLDLSIAYIKTRSNEYFTISVILIIRSGITNALRITLLNHGLCCNADMSMVCSHMHGCKYNLSLQKAKKEPTYNIGP